VILFRFLVADMYLGDGDIVAVLQQLVGECCRETDSEVLSFGISQ